MRLQSLIALAAVATPALAAPVGELVASLAQSVSGKPVTLSIGKKLYVPKATPRPAPGIGESLAAVPDNLTEM